MKQEESAPQAAGDVLPAEGARLPQVHHDEVLLHALLTHIAHAKLQDRIGITS